MTQIHHLSAHLQHRPLVTFRIQMQQRTDVDEHDLPRRIDQHISAVQCTVNQSRGMEMLDRMNQFPHQPNGFFAFAIRIGHVDIERSAFNEIPNKKCPISLPLNTAKIRHVRHRNLAHTPKAIGDVGIELAFEEAVGWEKLQNDGFARLNRVRESSWRARVL